MLLGYLPCKMSGNNYLTIIPESFSCKSLCDSVSQFGRNVVLRIKRLNIVNGFHSSFSFSWYELVKTFAAELFIYQFHIHVKLIGNHVPISTSYAPMRHDIFRRKLQNFLQTVIVSKRRLVFGNLAELTVESLDNIRRIYYLPNLSGIYKNVDKMSQFSSQLLTQLG